MIVAVKIIEIDRPIFAADVRFVAGFQIARRTADGIGGAVAIVVETV